MKTDLSSKIKILMVLFWTLFNLTLTAWWMTFGLRLIKQVEKLSLNDLTRKQKMLLWEGGILFFMLITGGAALVYFVFREIQTNQKLRTFFATFSHDLKTSITSLRLQVESILDDPSPPSASSSTPFVSSASSHSHSHLSRLVQDTVRLQLQLENALYLAQTDSTRFFKQEVELAKVLNSLQYHWPHLQIFYSGSHRIFVDAKALESILTNLIQNSMLHGKATQVTVQIENPASSPFYSLYLRDNGQGFQGKVGDLAKLFYRHNSKSGSGIGLYMVKSLVEKMRGKVKFKSLEENGNRSKDKGGRGFEVRINLPNCPLPKGRGIKARKSKRFVKAPFLLLLLLAL